MTELYIDASSAHVRLALRVYFTVILLLLGFLGGRCCVRRIELRLYRHEKIRISQMTGWLSGVDAAIALVALRASPAGWLGPLMIVASLLGLVCDLAVSGLVVTTDVVSRCPFNMTGMYTALALIPLVPRIGVDNAGPLFNIITQAQSTSLGNGGLDGIFKKVNTDVNFRADAQDIAGGWKCNPTGENKTFLASFPPENISYALQADGLLFEQSCEECWTFHPDSSTNQLFIWTASQDDHPKQPWQIRAAVDKTPNGELDKVMEIYECSMDAPSADWILNLTIPSTALAYWCNEIRGGLFPDNVANAAEIFKDPRLVMASGLNNIIMNAGAAWNDAESPLIIDDPTQGCLAPRALVPWPVVALFGVVTLTTVAISIYMVVLTLLIERARKECSGTYIKTVEYHTPNGLFSWMRRATYETDRRWRADHAWARHWAFGPTLNHESTGLLRVDEDHEENVLLGVQQHTIRRKPLSTSDGSYTSDVSWT